MELYSVDTYRMPVTHLTPTETRPKSLDDYAREYLAGFLNKNTRENYAVDLRHFLAATQGHLSEESVLVYRELVCTSMAPRSANRRLISIKGFLEYLANNHVVTISALSLVKRLGPKVDKYDSPTVALTDDEVRLMIDSRDTSTLLGASQRMALVLGFYMGLRVSEMVKLRIIMIDGGVLSMVGKGGKLRKLAVDEVVLREIRDYFQRTSVIFGRIRDESEFLLVTQKSTDGSKVVDTDTVGKWFKATAKECGIDKRVTTHTGRATAITKLLDNDTTLRDTAIFAGHSSVDTTTIYDKRRHVTSEKIVGRIKY